MNRSTIIVTELEQVKKELHDAKEDLAMKDLIIYQLKQQIVELQASTYNRDSSNINYESSFLKVILFLIVV